MLKVNSITLITISLLSFILMVYEEVNGFYLDRFIAYGFASSILLLSIIALEKTDFIKNNSLVKLLV